MGERLDAFREHWLGSALVPPPVVAHEWKEAAGNRVRLEVLPIRVEEARWNQWPDGTSRLFNSRAGLFFTVRVTADGPVSWDPKGTTLEVNREGDPIGAASSPEYWLAPLLAAAVQQERHGLSGDFVARTRAAGPFRGAYLPMHGAEGQIEGVVGFPIDRDEDAVYGFRITVSGRVGQDPFSLALVYD